MNITNEDFQKALKDKDNIGIIRLVTNKYKRQLSKDVLEECGLLALWKCMKSYNNEFKQKFTSSLYRFVTWECLRELSKNKKERDKHIISLDFDVKTESPSNIVEILELLPVKNRTIISEYYIDRYTLKELSERHNCSKEDIRKILKKSLSIIKNKVVVGV